MQGINISYYARPLQRFEEVALRGQMSIASSVQNLMWMWPRKVSGYGISDIMSRNFQEVWSQGQGAWKRPSPRYLARKAKLGQSPLTMVRTHRLYHALTAPGGTADSVNFGTARNYFYGVNAESFRDAGGWSYPEVHQFRGDSTGTTRPFMRMTPQAVENVHAWVGQCMRDRLKEIAGTLRMRGARVQ